MNTDRQAQLEAAYCTRIAEGLLEYELDPRNFTSEMRVRNKFARRGLASRDYNGYTRVRADALR